MNSICNKKLKKKVLHMIQFQVYHIQNGIANIMLYLRQSIEGKRFMGQDDWR